MGSYPNGSGGTGAWWDGREAPPSAAPAGASGQRVSYPKSLGTLYLRTTWNPGQEGGLILSVPAGSQRVPLVALEIPKARRPRRLLVDVDWVDVAYERRWPDFFPLLGTVGLNTVRLSKTDTARPFRILDGRAPC